MSRQSLFLVLVALGAAISFSWVQGLFDRSDHRKAEQLVRSFSGAQGQTLEALLARKDERAHRNEAWSSEILSGCRGVVRVHCKLPQAGEYAFDVDLVRKAIHPGNEQGRAALEALAGPTRPSTSPQGR